MGVKIQVLIILIAIMCFASVSFAAEGTATFYKPPYVPSACYRYEDFGQLIAGASDSIWENGAACGRLYTVKCIGATNLAPNPCKHGSISVVIVDYCPPGCRGTINLSEEAFTQIADPSVGRIKIEYTREI